MAVAVKKDAVTGKFNMGFLPGRTQQGECAGIVVFFNIIQDGLCIVPYDFIHICLVHIMGLFPWWIKDHPYADKDHHGQQQKKPKETDG